MRVTDFLPEDCIRPSLKAGDQTGVLHELAEHLAVGTGVPAATIERLLVERERTATTAIGEGVAIPHCRVPGLRRIAACLGVRRSGVAFAGSGSPPVRLVMAIVSPPDTAGMHLKVLARTAALLRSATLREALLEAPSAATMRELLVEAENAYLASRAPPAGDPRAL